MRFLQYRIEHRCEVAGRAVDDLQYLGGRGLLLQRLARLGNQPRVLHRDHRLRSEILQQRDLLVGKWPHLPAIDGQCAEQGILFAQRNSKQGAATANIHKPSGALVAGAVKIGIRDIGHMDDAVAAQEARPGDTKRWR